MSLRWNLNAPAPLFPPTTTLSLFLLLLHQLDSDDDDCLTDSSEFGVWWEAPASSGSSVIDHSLEPPILMCLLQPRCSSPFSQIYRSTRFQTCNHVLGKTALFGLSLGVYQLHIRVEFSSTRGYVWSYCISSSFQEDDDRPECIRYSLASITDWQCLHEAL